MIIEYIDKLVQNSFLQGLIKIGVMISLIPFVVYAAVLFIAEDKGMERVRKKDELSEVRKERENKSD